MGIRNPDSFREGVLDPVLKRSGTRRPRIIQPETGKYWRRNGWSGP